MRLTLRTLLAYIDGVLPTEESQLLEAKIRESRIAQNTMERIDHGMARKDLGSPATTARPSEQDANTVAEYLDNTMSPDQLPHFEKTCFENDAQLIEVAAVHRILSVVLTKPISVSETLRRRVRQIRNTTQAVAAESSDDPTVGVIPPVVVPIPASQQDSVRTNGKVGGSELGAIDSRSTSSVNLQGKNLRFDSSHSSDAVAQTQSESRGMPTEQTSAPVSAIHAANLATQGLDLTDDRTNAVPEYLRDRSEGVLSQFVIVSLLIVALFAVAFYSIGPIDQIAALFSATSPSSDVSTESIPSTDAVAVDSDSTPIVVGDASPVPPSSLAGEPTLLNGGTSKPSLAPEPESTGESVSTTSSEASVVGNKVDAEISVADAAPPLTPESDLTRSIASDVPATVDDSAMITSSDVAPPIAEASVAPPSPAAADESNEEGAIAMTSNAPPPIPSPESATSGENSGEVATASQLSWQPETKDSAAAIVMSLSNVSPEPAVGGFVEKKLRLMNVAEALPIEDRMIVPNAYRTEVRIQPGLKWVVASATDMQGEQGAEKNTAYVRLRLGRALLHASSDCSAVVLRIQNADYKVQLDSPSAIASVELKYFQNAGVPVSPNADAEEDQPFVVPVVTIACVAGSMDVRTKSGLSWSDAETCGEGQAVAFINHERQLQYTLAEVPWWYRTSIERPIDSGAAEDLALELQTLPPELRGDAVDGNEALARLDLISVLQEATKLRRAETAALAARTLALLGRYDSIFGSDGILNQSSSRPHRTLIINAVVQSLGIDEEYRNSLAKSLNAYDPPRGSRLLSLMTLPDAKMLAMPSGAQPYIDALSSSFLDERVLGIHQLASITGREYAYQPDRVTSEALAQWRKLHSSGKIEWNRFSVKPLDVPAQ